GAARDERLGRAAARGQPPAGVGCARRARSRQRGAALGTPAARLATAAARSTSRTGAAAAGRAPARATTAGGDLRRRGRFVLTFAACWRYRFARSPRPITTA